MNLIFSAPVYHIPGLCLIGIGGTPLNSHKIIAQKPYFHIFLRNDQQLVLHVRPVVECVCLYLLSKIIIKLHLHAFWHNSANGMKKFCSCLQDI